MTHQIVNPEALGKPKGYSNGVLAAPGRVLFIAGQVGWDGEQRIVSESFVAQFDQALSNVVAVLTAAGGRPEHICRMTMYVADKEEYAREVREVGARYRARMGKNYPAMSLVEVSALLEEGAKVELEATAVIPEQELAGARGGG